MKSQKVGVDSLENLTSGPAISELGQKPNGQMSSAGGFRQYTVTNCFIVASTGPLRFKKFTMLFETEQLLSSKTAGDQNPSAKHSMSGGYVVSTSLDAMTSDGQ